MQALYVENQKPVLSGHIPDRLTIGKEHHVLSTVSRPRNVFNSCVFYSHCDISPPFFELANEGMVYEQVSDVIWKLSIFPRLASYTTWIILWRILRTWWRLKIVKAFSSVRKPATGDMIPTLWATRPYHFFDPFFTDHFHCNGPLSGSDRTRTVNYKVEVNVRLPLVMKLFKKLIFGK